MSQQCWRPPSPMAAGLPSGWRCRPAGPVSSSTSGCCWVLCAAASLNPDLAAHVSNGARRPPVTSLSASDSPCEGPGRREVDKGKTWARGQMTPSLLVVPHRRGFSGIEVMGVRVQRLTVLWEGPTRRFSTPLMTGWDPDVTGLTTWHETTNEEDLAVVWKHTYSTNCQRESGGVNSHSL